MKRERELFSATDGKCHLKVSGEERKGASFSLTFPPLRSKAVLRPGTHTCPEGKHSSYYGNRGQSPATLCRHASQAAFGRGEPASPATVAAGSAPCSGPGGPATASSTAETASASRQPESGPCCAAAPSAPRTAPGGRRSEPGPRSPPPRHLRRPRPIPLPWSRHPGVPPSRRSRRSAVPVPPPPTQPQGASPKLLPPPGAAVAVFPHAQPDAATRRYTDTAPHRHHATPTRQHRARGTPAALPTCPPSTAQRCGCRRSGGATRCGAAESRGRAALPAGGFPGCPSPSPVRSAPQGGQPGAYLAR